MVRTLCAFFACVVVAAVHGAGFHSVIAEKDRGLPCFLRSNIAECGERKDCTFVANECRLYGTNNKDTDAEMTSGEKKKKNLIISLADDMGYYDFASPARFTPTFDALKKNAVFLARHYSAKMCSPSRSSLITGRQYFTLGFAGDSNLAPIRGTRCGLPIQVPTFADEMKNAGYSTSAYGKWHLGFHSDAHAPPFRGFDNYYGNLGGPIDHKSGFGPQCVCAQSGKKNQCRTKSSYSDLVDYDKEEWACTTAYALVQMNRTLYRKGESVKPDGHVDLHLARKVSEEIDTFAAAKSPFFIYIGWTTPHGPNEPFPEYMARISLNSSSVLSNPLTRLCGLKKVVKRRAEYLGELAVLDQAQSIVLNALERNDLVGNSIFAFLSDNGGRIVHRSNQKVENLCDGDSWSSNYPLRGGKYSLFEGGMRTPALLFEKSLTPRIYEEFFHITDWVFTLREALEIPAPWVIAPTELQKGIYGQSHWNRLQEKQPFPVREEMLLQMWTTSSYGLRAALIKQIGGVFYKIIMGYPATPANNNGNDGNIDPVKDGYFGNLEIPYEVDERQTDLYDASIIANDGNLHRCMKNPCVFDIMNDPSEVTNLYDDLEKTNATILSILRKEIKKNVELQKQNDLQDSFCDANFGVAPDDWVTDKKSFLVTKKCGAWLPWVRVKGNKKIPCTR